jgi:ABC-type branched-subunit amino acid transport system ATPase component
MTTLAVRNLSKSFGGVHAVRDLSFSVAAGERLALIGPNGAGKTTCFNLIDGQLRPDAGEILLDGRRIQGMAPRALCRLGIGRSFQVAAVFGSMTVRENVQVALLARERRLGSVFFSASEAFAEEAQSQLDRVGMAGQSHRPCAELAYGDLKRVELAVALAGRPRLLLMDEPTAGMAAPERRALMELVERIARERNLSVLFTEHDMDVVFRHADRVVVLAEGALLAEGAPADVRADARVRAAYLGEDGGDA